METKITMTMEMLMGNETNVTEMAMEGNGSGVLDYINKSMWMTMRRCMNMSKSMDENTSENTNEISSSDMPGTPCKQMGIYLVNNTMSLKLVIGSTLPNLSFWQNAGWMKGKMPEGERESEDLLGQQMEP